MKKFSILIISILILGSCYDDSARIKALQQSNQAQKSAMSAVDVPDLTYFQERRTIAKWADYWDKPEKDCYVYLFSHGKLIAIFVADGKPASTNSLLTPEYKREINHEALQQLPDIDGTFGTNNPGIRFFTKEGIAVEWGGEGATYIYADFPITGYLQNTQN